MKTINTKYRIGWMLCALVAFSSCVKEDFEKVSPETLANLEFKATVLETGSVTTRADENGDGKNMNEAKERNISEASFGVPYFIRKEVILDSPNDTEQQEDMGDNTIRGNYDSRAYVVASNWVGRLAEMTTGDKLMWRDVLSKHFFYGWTMPWVNTEPQTIRVAAATDSTTLTIPGIQEEAETGGKTIQELNDMSTAPTLISFVPEDYAQLDSTAWFNPKTDAKNARVLEKFIGTQAGAENGISYQVNGEYVKLQFRHLVSKVRISSMEFQRADGSVSRVVQGRMTIFGLPRYGYFYRRPVNKFGANELPSPDDYEGVTPSVADHRWYIGPYVEWAPELMTKYGTGVTFDISEGAEFYVCPEWDWADTQFEVLLKTPEVDAKWAPFVGSFTVNFHRADADKKEDWDGNSGNDKTILHAGEAMSLYVKLYEGNSGSVSGDIQNWNEDSWRSGQTNPHNGIYDGDWSEVFEYLSNDNPADPTGAQDRFDTKYWDEEYWNPETGEVSKEKPEGEAPAIKRVKFYDDTNIHGSMIPSKDGYMLDGMGHTVTVDADEVTIEGDVRDIYISDGENTIYIDKEGNVFVVDEDGDLLATDKTLKALQGEDNQFKLSDVQTYTKSIQNAAGLSAVLEALADSPVNEESLAAYDAGKKLKDEVTNVLLLSADIGDFSKSSIPMAPGYVLDGQGHTVKMTASEGSITIGNLRNIYLEYEVNGESFKLYVDEYGRVWNNFNSDGTTPEIPALGKLTLDKVFEIKYEKTKPDNDSEEIAEWTFKETTV